MPHKDKWLWEAADLFRQVGELSDLLATKDIQPSVKETALVLLKRAEKTLSRMRTLVNDL